MITRRQLLKLSGSGMGMLALADLLDQDAHAAKLPALDLTRKSPHHKPRAKSVVLMMQNGGPSQMDLFDPKPLLQERSGKAHSIKVEMFQPGSENNVLLGSPFKFRKYGQSGLPFSDAVPNIAGQADNWCVIRSMHSGHNNHTEALVMFMTGKQFQGRPSFGSWISYGLGTENQNLPAYIVLRDPAGYNTSGTLVWSAGWLPSIYSGTEFNAQGSPVLNLKSSRKLPKGVQATNLQFLAKLNRIHKKRYPLESKLEARIQNYELAARMQLEATKVLDISNETAATRKLYGLDNPTTRKYGLRCLLARKLVEAGVRFVQIHPKPFQPWDTHSNTKQNLTSICSNTDLPTAGLVQDLKQRGLLDETMVVWSGEFGRLPVSQNGTGRDHNRNAFSVLVAGGGFKSGVAYGATDEVGYKAAEKRVSMSDLHATILHQMGLDHEELIFEHAGREETLTDTSLTDASVHHGLLG